MTTPRPCPDCEQNKHRNCDGCTWDNDADGLTACPCDQAGHVAALLALRPAESIALTPEQAMIRRGTGRDGES